MEAPTFVEVVYRKVLGKHYDKYKFWLALIHMLMIYAMIPMILYMIYYMRVGCPEYCLESMCPFISSVEQTNTMLFQQKQFLNGTLNITNLTL